MRHAAGTQQTSDVINRNIRKFQLILCTFLPWDPISCSAGRSHRDSRSRECRELKWKRHPRLQPDECELIYKDWTLLHETDRKGYRGHGATLSNWIAFIAQKYRETACVSAWVMPDKMSSYIGICRPRGQIMRVQCRMCWDALAKCTC